MSLLLLEPSLQGWIRFGQQSMKTAFRRNAVNQGTEVEILGYFYGLVGQEEWWEIKAKQAKVTTPHGTSWALS